MFLLQIRLIGQEYEHLITGKKVEEGQAYVLQKDSFIIEVSIVTTKLITGKEM